MHFNAKIWLLPTGVPATKSCTVSGVSRTREVPGYLECTRLIEQLRHPGSRCGATLQKLCSDADQLAKNLRSRFVWNLLSLWCQATCMSPAHLCPSSVND
uniref:Uncharacterized protein n=1 Tax=Hyaloperonospora arabidopsidis (strain Emoy2) TaxID=559515 RepID=M4BYG4_HYAAE